MATDLTGGIDPAREYPFAERPDNPEMRDSVSFWTFDEAGAVGLPRVGIEAVASNWDSHNVQVNVAFADGRVYRLREDAPSRPVNGPDGKPSVLGAGPLAFTCVEPFSVWTMTFDGKAIATSSADLVAGRKDGPLVDIRFEVEAKPAVPPWVQGTLAGGCRLSAQDVHRGRPHGWAALRAAVPCDGLGDGRGRGAHLHAAAGCVSSARACASSKASGGIVGNRRCSEAAAAFGYIAYPPRPDGQPTFNEGYCLLGRRRTDPGDRGRGAVAEPAAAVG